MAKADGKILFEILADDSEFRKKIGGLKQSVTSGASAMTVAVGSLIADMVEKVASAAGSIAQSALDGYADYEQLTGGIETLYGDAYDTVMANAETAFKRVGMSQNQYMATVTSYAATLRQAVGGDVQRAAQQSDKALREMADNANKMGTDMSSIQDAFNGFAKQNYTMLDNLKLGYGGTKTEMERLLADAEKISGVHYDISNFSDVIDAIGVVQDELGITGTTAEEAASTISGSLGMLKASWEDWLSQLMNGEGDIQQETDNLMESLGLVIQNIAPKIGTAIQSVGSAIPSMLGTLKANLPGFMNEVFATLDSAGLSAVSSGVTGFLRNIAQSGAVGELTSSFSSLTDTIGGLTGGLENLDGIAHQVGDGIGTVFGGIADLVSGVIDGINEQLQSSDMAWALSEMDTGFQQLSSTVGPFVETVMKPLGVTIGHILGAGIILITTFIAGAAQLVSDIMGKITALTQFLSTVPKQIQGFFSGIGAWFGNTFERVRSSIVSKFNAAKTTLSGIPGQIVAFFTSIPGRIGGAVAGVASRLSQPFTHARSTISSIPGRIVSFFTSLPGRIGGAASAVVSRLPQPFRNAASTISSVPGRIVGFFTSLPGKIGSAVSGIASRLPQPFKSAWNTISSIPRRIASAFSGLHIRIPHFSLPHVNITWRGSPIKLPHFSVSWHALGGVIGAPTLFADGTGGLHGMGERGAEAMIQPLDGPIGRGWADFVAERVALKQYGNEVVAEWLERNLGATIAAYAPTATPREFGRMVREVR